MKRAHVIFFLTTTGGSRGAGHRAQGGSCPPATPLAPPMAVKYSSALVLLVIAAISLPHTGADYTEHGGTCTHFYKLLVRGGTVSRRTANKKATKQLPFRKALAKTTCRTKKLEKHDKKIFRRLAPDTYPPLLNSFWCHWPRSPSQCNIALISFDLKWPQL